MSRLQNKIRLQENDSGSEFEAAADFFSVLGIAAIFMAITFGSTLVVNDPADTTFVERSTSGGQIVAEDTLVLLVTVTQGDQWVEIIKAGQRLKKIRVSFSPRNERKRSIDSILRHVEEQQNFSKVLCLAKLDGSDLLRAFHSELVENLQQREIPLGVAFID